MTELQQAFNQGVDAALELVRLAAACVPESHSLPADGLRAVADEINAVKFSDQGEART
jgi:hypothetical protein